MIYASKSARLYAASLVFLLCSLFPARSFAEMPDADAMIDYSFKGFTLGVEFGLSVGYLATGERYREREWRTLVLGMGIGAFAGVTAGIFISAADYAGRGSSVGYYILRDTNYGTLIGAAMGAVVGALFWLDDGLPRDLLRGTAYGMLFGGVAGITYGIIESRNAKPRFYRRRNRDRDDYDDWRLSVAPGPSGGMVGVSKHF
jgi:hypothetical protein